MPFRGVIFAVAACLVVHGTTMAQAPNVGGSAPRPLRKVSANSQSLALPPVPNDPLELVAGDAQPVQDAEQRAAAMNLLAKARALSNVRAYPYDLKTTFVSSGASEGSWSLEDTSPSRDIYRWSAQGPSYSVSYTHLTLPTNREV